MTHTPVALILTTAGSAEAAESLGRTLVEEGHAACATVFPAVTSVYRWEGTLQRETEAQLLLKTAPAAVEAAVARLAALHPYRLPEVLTLEAAASAAYARWVGEAAAAGE